MLSLGIYVKIISRQLFISANLLLKRHFSRRYAKSFAQYGNKIEKRCNGAKVREALTKCKYVRKTFEIVLQYLLNFHSTWNVIYIDPSRKVFYHLYVVFHKEMRVRNDRFSTRSITYGISWESRKWYRLYFR